MEEQKTIKRFQKKAFYYSAHKSPEDTRSLYAVKCFLYEHYYEYLKEYLGYSMFDEILTKYSIQELGFNAPTKKPSMDVAAVKIQTDFQKFRKWLDKNYIPGRKQPPNEHSINGLQQGGEKDHPEETLPENKT